MIGTSTKFNKIGDKNAGNRQFISPPIEDGSILGSGVG